MFDQFVANTQQVLPLGVEYSPWGHLQSNERADGKVELCKHYTVSEKYVHGKGCFSEDVVWFWS